MTKLEDKFGLVQYITCDNNGNILRTGTCLASDLEHQKEPDEYVIKQENQNDVIRDDTHRVENGKIINKNDKKI